MSLERLDILGNLSCDAEQKYLPNGTSVVEFLAGRRIWFWRQKVTMCTRAMFGDRGAKVLQYWSKRQQVAVSGEPKLREW